MHQNRIYFLSIFILIVAAIFSKGYYHFDEQIQILEFAGVKLNLTTVHFMPWEYNYQMRPALQPLMVVFLGTMMDFFHYQNPFFIAFILRLCSATIGFLAMYLMYQSYCKIITDDTLQKWFLWLSFLLWMMIFNCVRFSSESWSGSLFLISFALLNNKPNANKLNYFLIGILIGFSFLFRYQTGFLIAGLLLWYWGIQKNIYNAILISLGVLLMIGVGILIDKWFYGKWTLTTWNYFSQNILQGKMAEFGTEPWWYFFKQTFIQAIPPFSILMIVGFLIVIFTQRKDRLTFTLFPFLFTHFLIGHKELRFMFPIIGFAPIMIIKALEWMQQKWKLNWKNVWVNFFAKLMITINIIYLIVIAFKPANSLIDLYQFIYNDCKQASTVLYHLKDNPYERVMMVNFYKPKNLEFLAIDSNQKIELSKNKKHLLVLNNPDEIKNLNIKSKLVYTTLPHWIFNFNFNHWIDRTECWYLYELD